jgi:hypothetical protein
VEGVCRDEEPRTPLGPYRVSMHVHSYMPRLPDGRHVSMEQYERWEHDQAMRSLPDDGIDYTPGNWSVRIKDLRADYARKLKAGVREDVAVQSLIERFGFVFAVKYLKAVSQKAKQLFGKYPTRFK